ncbi:MAG: transport-associated protein [Francisellaceae bacterium]|nr:transport-associated protein [Francisellaceae bacterium]
MKSDSQLYNKIIEKLFFTPEVNFNGIKIAVHKGIAVLIVFVNIYNEKIAPEHIIKNTKGIKSISNEIKITPISSHQKFHTEFTQAALHVLTDNTIVCRNNIKVIVADGWVMLNKIVEWYYQKCAAEEAIRHLYGICGIKNNIQIKFKEIIFLNELISKVDKEFKRNALINASSIHFDEQETNPF